MNASSLIATALKIIQIHVVIIITKVIADTSVALFLLNVLISCGTPIDAPVTTPIQLKSCDNSIFRLQG